MKLENRFTVPVPRDEAWKVLLDVERIAPCMPGATLTSRDGDSFTGTVKVKVGPINLTYGGQARFVSLDEAAGIAVIEGSGKETRGTGTAKAVITCRLVDQGGSSTDVEVETDLNVTGKPAQFGRGVLADVSGKLVDRFATCLSQEIAAGDPVPAAGPATPAPADAPSATPAPVTTGEAAANRVPSGTTGFDVASEALMAAAAPAAASTAASAAPSPQTSATSAAPDAAAVAAPRPRVVREAEPIDLLDAAGAPVLKRLAPVLAGVVVLLLLVRRLLR